MPHRESIKEYLRNIRIEEGKIIDWGKGTKPVMNYIQTGENVSYFGIDKLSHVDAHLVADMQQQIILEEFDVAFCMEVLEHVPDYMALLENIYNNLKTDGLLYLSVPFLYKIHHEEDYWRFTDKGITLVLERSGFAVEEIVPTEANAGWIVKARKK